MKMLFLLIEIQVNLKNKIILIIFTLCLIQFYIITRLSLEHFTECDFILRVHACFNINFA